MQVYDKFAI